jgi:hypothetical protein
VVAACVNAPKYPEGTVIIPALSAKAGSQDPVFALGSIDPTAVFIPTPTLVSLPMHVIYE